MHISDWSSDVCSSDLTYICGNPPYKGTKNQSATEKDDLKNLFGRFTKRSGTLDYVSGWFLKAALYTTSTRADFAFVTTNSICQGGQVPVLWPILLDMGCEIKFAYQSFKWRNLASQNAVVTVIVVGVSQEAGANRRSEERRVGKEGVSMCRLRWWR